MKVTLTRLNNDMNSRTQKTEKLTATKQSELLKAFSGQLTLERDNVDLLQDLCVLNTYIII